MGWNPLDQGNPSKHSQKHPQIPSAELRIKLWDPRTLHPKIPWNSLKKQEEGGLEYKDLLTRDTQRDNSHPSREGNPLSPPIPTWKTFPAPPHTPEQAGMGIPIAPRVILGCSGMFWQLKYSKFIVARRKPRRSPEVFFQVKIGNGQKNTLKVPE